MRRAAVYIVILLALLFPPTNQLAAQDNNLWLYDVVDLEDSYELIRTEVIDGHSEHILSVPKTIPVSLTSIIPASEVEAAQSYFQEWAEQYPRTDINLFLAKQPVVSVRSFTPAPDNESVALNVTYQACAKGYFNEVCFGMSQIILVSGDTGQQQVLWNLGFHSADYFPGRLLPVEDVQIDDLLWLPDQQALIAAISDEALRRNWAGSLIVIISTLQGAPPFRIGEGVTWATAPDSREMAIISWDTGLGHVLHRINLDSTTGHLPETSFPLSPYFIYPDIGQAYIQDSVVFFIAYDASSIVDLSGIGVFTPGQPTPLTIVRPEIGGYRKIQASTTGDVAVIQNADGLLWKTTIFDGVLWVAPLTESPVTFWQFVKDDILVYQFLGSTQYRIVDLSPMSP